MTNKTTYSDTFQLSSEFLRLAISLLSKNHIPANPHNYQIAYEYVSGRNQSLIDDLSPLLDQPDPPSETKLSKLHNRYFVQDEEFLDLMRKEIRGIISNVMKGFDQSGDQLSDYTQKLNAFANMADSKKSPDFILEETKKVIEETHFMEQSQHAMESQIVNAVAKIDSLRKELEQVKEESNTDTLTGISNRRGFDSSLDQLINTTEKESNPFCLMLLDIDHFKAFNDNYGHLIGDKVLRYIATSLKRNVKGKDFVARFGGEEFVILLPKTNIDGAMVVAETVRDSISSGKLVDKKSDTSYGKVTISIGVTQFQSGDSSIDIIGRADKALYLAKDHGRNRVEKL